MVRTVKEAMILAILKEESRSSHELAETLGLDKPNITKSLTEMKRMGLVDGWGTYEITEKGKVHVQRAFEKINIR